MFGNQIQQVQQKLNAIQQLANQMQQSQQRMQQMAQESSYSTQQLQRIQQISQECFSNLQNISGQQMSSQNPAYTTGISGQYGQTTNYSTGMGMMAGQGYPQSNTLFNQATMNPDTYQNAAQFAGASQNYGAGTFMPGGQQTMQQGTPQYGSQMGGQQYQQGGQGYQMRTQSPLSDIASMNTDTYLASQNQFGKGSPNLQQIGQQAGVNLGTMGANAGNMSGSSMNMGKNPMGTSSSLSNISTMNPDTYQGAKQQLGGTSASLKEIGQQAGVTNPNKTYQ